MINCVIHPIPIFSVPWQGSVFTFRQNFNKMLTNVCYAWYIEGPEQKILVDAGGGVEYFADYLKLKATPIQTLDDGLGKLGLGFEDIDVIIATHLHWDHCAQAHRFPKARVIVQKEELDAARSSHPLFVGDYPKQFFEGLNFEIVAGDAQICDGVSVLHSPGHTPGGQSVIVRTAKGIAIIVGMCSIRQNFEPPARVKDTMPVLIPGTYYDPFKAYDSCLKVKRLADILIPLHDAENEKVGTIP